MHLPNNRSGEGDWYAKGREMWSSLVSTGVTVTAETVQDLC